MDVNELPLVKTINNEYKQYNAGDFVFIGAGCGAGKTSFILEILGIFAQENNKKVLFLSNRSELKKEIQNRIDKNELNNTITNITYQTFQENILLDINGFNKEKIEMFDYIICDECHYFLTDSWNGVTDISYYQILEAKHPIKVYMTATFNDIFEFLTNDICEIEDMNMDKIHGYRINLNYEYIENITFYKYDDCIINVINNLPDSEKLIYFSKDIKKLFELHKNYKNNSSFVCSKYRKEYKKHITESAINNNKLTNKLTFATSVWDNGINIIDPDVKHVVIDIPDKVILIQCLGRVRNLKDGTKIKVYIRNWSTQNLAHFASGETANKRLADEYEKDMNKSIALYKLGKKYKSKCHVQDSNNEGKLILNKLMYKRTIKLIDEYKKDKEIGFSNAILSILKIENDKVKCENYPKEFKEKFLIELYTYLKSVNGENLFAKQQEKITNIIKSNTILVNKFKINKKTKKITSKKLQKILDFLKSTFHLRGEYKVSEPKQQSTGENKGERYITITKTAQ